MKCVKIRTVPQKTSHTFLILICIIVILASVFFLFIKCEQWSARRNLDAFSNQLFSHTLPDDSTALDEIAITGATAGMGDNRFYYAILMIESSLTQQEIEAYYKTTDFAAAQEKSHFSDSAPVLQTRVVPISDWNILKQELCNIKDKNVFSGWESSERNEDCFLIVLSDGAYPWFFSQDPYYE